MKRICVFCGSSPGTRDEYSEAAIALGAEMVRREIGLVYGGGKRGLMRRIAQTVHESGGEVIGVIPKALAKKELAFDELCDLRVVGSMHERKAQMAELSDGFIAMPGGFDTFEELLETITWSQLGIHDKPVGLLNVEGYFDPLVSMFEHAVSEGFIKKEHQTLVQVDRDPGSLIDCLESWTAPPSDKVRWILSMDES